jgi:phosphatidylglycerophosphatase B
MSGRWLRRPGPDPGATSRPPTGKALLPVLGLAIAGVAVGSFLPSIDLGAGVADLMVRISDTAYWVQMPFICLAMVTLLATRRGPTVRRRFGEAGVVIVAMLVILAGNALVNEHIVKPALGVARPNIVSLAENGVLGPGISDGDAFYALGDKDERREFLSGRLTPASTPDLSDLVRDHWIHEAGYAFPSGHTMTALAFASLWAGLALLWMSGWRLIVTLVALPIWAIAVAWSRLLLEIHTTADVVVGALVGAALGSVAFLAIRRLIGRW